jgi:SAM-dependent methyltransferase
MTTSLSADAIFDIGCSFWKAKVLLSAVELDLFTVLASQGPLDIAVIRNRIGLHERGAQDFLDALAALGLLVRDDQRRYANSAEADAFLDRAKATYCGGFLEMCNANLYPAWAGLTQALQTGQSVRSGDHSTEWYARLYANDDSRDVFLAGMTGGARPAARAIARQFPWGHHRVVLDVGCAEGCLVTEIVQAHPHLHAIGFDLAPVASSFDRLTAAHGVSDRVAFQPGDFRVDTFPGADVIVFGRVLHNWGLATREFLLAKAFAALPPGGRVLVYERLIDDERKTNATALLASLNMRIVTPEGGDFTGQECVSWMLAAGFRDPFVEPLVASHAMVVGTK